MRHERTRWKDRIHLLVARWLTIPLVEESAAFLKCPPVSNCQTQLHQIESKCKATVYGPSVSIFGPSLSGASHTVGQSHWLVVQQSESVHVKRIAKKGIAHWDRCCSIHDFTHLLQLLPNFHLCLFSNAIFNFLKSDMFSIRSGWFNESGVKKKKNTTSAQHRLYFGPECFGLYWWILATRGISLPAGAKHSS